MNFAAVMKAPVVFFVQNNGWAISVPTERQVAGGSVAARAAGYGIPGLQVDGNDVVAVLEATGRAIAHCPLRQRARGGRSHDLPPRPALHVRWSGRYRSLDEERSGAGENPLGRLRQRLLDDGIADDDFFAAAQAAAAAEEAIREGIEALGPRPGSEMFDLVFQETTPALQNQAASWREESEHV